MLQSECFTPFYMRRLKCFITTSLECCFVKHITAREVNALCPVGKQDSRMTWARLKTPGGFKICDVGKSVWACWNANALPVSIFFVA